MRSWIPFAFVASVLAAPFGCSAETKATPPTDESPDGGTRDRDDDEATSPVVTTTETLDVDGTLRHYMLSVPKNYDADRAYPLIVALHGDGQDAASFTTYSNLAKASGQDAIIAFPDQSVELFVPYWDNVDQMMIEAIIDTVKANRSIDGSKIWGFGYSKGAYQLNEIACRRPGLLTAMAIHAGGAPQERDDNGDVDCPEAIGIPTFVVHGGNDDVGGGRFGADYWASRANCDGTLSESSPPMCEAYNGCDEGKPVVFCVVPEQPHSPLYANAAVDSWAWFTSL